MSEVGTETVAGEELYRFSNAGRSEGDEQVEWVSTRALVDEDGLVHSFQNRSIVPTGIRAGFRSGTY